MEGSSKKGLKRLEYIRRADLGQERVKVSDPHIKTMSYEFLLKIGLGVVL